MSSLLIISPHIDDAVFSCWRALNSTNSTVLTVFAGIPDKDHSTYWDRICGQINSIEAMNLRRAENDTILGHTKTKIQYLDFLDSQYRNYPIKMADLTNEIIKHHNLNSEILVPLAMGKPYRHKDHVLLRKVGIELLNNGFSVSFYPDLPYMTLPLIPTQDYLKQLAIKASILLSINVTATVLPLSKTQIQSKLIAAKSYQTQYKMTNLISLGRLSRQLERNYEIRLSVC